MYTVENIFVTHSVRICLTYSETIYIVSENEMVNGDDHVTITIIINNRNKLICPCSYKQIERECTFIF